MSATSATYAGRAIAESLMIDACVVSGGEETVFNEETLEWETVESIVYEGICELKFGNTAVRELDAAGQILTEQSAILKLPVDTSGAVREGHTATITDCVNDPSMVGHKFQVEGGHYRTYATSRRFPIKEVY